MAACGSLDHIFDKPLPENPTFLESLSPWKHIKSMAAIDDSSFTELFGELHFKENHVIHHHNPTPDQEPSSSSSSPFPQSSPSSFSSSNSTYSHESIENKNKSFKSSYYSYQPSTSEKKKYRHSNSFSSMNSESLSLCTEGLGFESFDDVDDLFKNEVFNNDEDRRSKSLTKNTQTHSQRCETKRSSRTSRGAFPPPISCIGRSGKPWVCFKSYREDGRFILKEIRIPTQEFLHACRENGRLKLQFIQSDDEILEEDDEEDEDEEGGNVEEENQDMSKNEIYGHEDDRNEREGKNNGNQNVETNFC